MAERIRRVVIAGATGLVGSEVLDLLLADPMVERVVSMGRRRTGREHDALTEVLVELEGIRDASIEPPVDAVLCCLGTTMRAAGSRDAFRAVDLDAPVALARLALAIGAPRFAMISSIGADPGARSFYLRAKGEAEQAVAALGIPKVVILRPSLLLGERSESRPAERLAGVALRILSPILVGPLRRWRPVHARSVARAMIELLVSGDTTGVLIVESDTIARTAGTGPS
jgi:uncharacterized protein YbjT (DUF2867 family)